MRGTAAGRLKKQSADDRVRTSVRIGNRYDHVTVDVPNQPEAVVITGNVAGIENRAGRLIRNVDALGSRTTTIPVQEIQGHAMGVPIGEVEVDRLIRGREPRRGNTICRGRWFLERPHVCGGTVPGKSTVSRDGNGRIGRVIDGVLDDVVAVSSV